MERDIIEALAKVRDYCKTKPNCINCDFKVFKGCLLKDKPCNWRLEWQLLDSKNVAK